MKTIDRIERLGDKVSFRMVNDNGNKRIVSVIATDTINKQRIIERNITRLWMVIKAQFGYK